MVWPWKKKIHPIPDGAKPRRMEIDPFNGLDQIIPREYNQVNTLTNDHFGPQKYNIMAFKWQLFFQFLNYAYNYAFDF